jgi:hypothetical protein
MIERATRYHIPRIYEILETEAFDNIAPFINESKNHDPDFVYKFLFEIINGKGFILIDKECTGIFIALFTNNIWCPAVKELRQLAWVVEKKERNKLVSGRLWKEFNRIASEMLKSKKIDTVISSLSCDAEYINLQKRGFTPLNVSFFRT